MKKPGSKHQLNNNQISGFQKANGQKRLTRKDKRIILKLILWGLFSVVILGVVFEWALEHIPGFILLSAYSIIIGFIFKEIWDFIKSKCKTTSEYQNISTSDQSIWEKIAAIFPLICHVALTNFEVLLGAVIILVVTGSAAWAQHHVTARVSYAIEAFREYSPTEIENVTEIEKKINQNAPVTSSSVEDLYPSDKPNNVINDNSQTPISELGSTPSKSTTEVFSPEISDYVPLDEPAEKAAQIEKARRMILEIPTKDWSISDDDRAQFLFTTGKYEISSNWTTEQAAIKLESYIEDVISCQYPNYFDLMADQALRNLVSEASSLDNILVSSREKDHIITVRLDAYALYGKASLARLLAEDFHCYALAFQYYNGDRTTITSYYLQSVKWLFESLKYAENPPESRLAILTSLRYRYNDIMTYSEPKSEQWEQAKLLADALAEIIEEHKLQAQTTSDY